MTARFRQIAGSLCLLAPLSPLPLRGEPVFDSRGIPYAAIEAEPALGTVKALNPAYNILVAQLGPNSPVKPGHYVALRRDGVIVCFAFVESIEPGAVATLELLRQTAGIHPITVPAIGDEIIRVLKPQPGARPD